MEEPEIDDGEKWLIAILIGVIFLIISSPFIYRLSNSTLGYVGLRTTDKAGHPIVFGWVIHAVAFIIIIRLFMK